MRKPQIAVPIFVPYEEMVFEKDGQKRFIVPQGEIDRIEKMLMQNAVLLTDQADRITELETALRYYADPTAWGQYHIVDAHDGGFLCDFSVFITKAQNALNKKGT